MRQHRLNDQDHPAWPYTPSRQAKDEHYNDGGALEIAYADAVIEEAHDLKHARVDIIQLDEPWMEQLLGKGKPRVAE